MSYEVLASACDGPRTPVEESCSPLAVGLAAAAAAATVEPPLGWAAKGAGGGGAMLEVRPSAELGGGLRALKGGAAGWGWGEGWGGAKGPMPCEVSRVQFRRGGRVRVQRLVKICQGKGLGG